jgi:4-amino-4-deoxy-L-arabinose transferase-like glycosyltransferase
MSKTKIVILALVLLGSIFLRLHRYILFPQRGATSDEYTYSFLGLSLLTRGVPESWSFFPGYKNMMPLTIDGIFFPMVKPYFDHPPLYGLLAGGWELIFGHNTYAKINLASLRLLPLTLVMLTSLMVFLLINKLYDFKTAIRSLVIFSTVTIFVMNSRVSVAENLFTLILMISLVCLSYWKRLDRKRIIILGLLSGAAFLTKVLGITVYVTILTILILRQERFKNLFIFSLIFLVLAALFPLYGAYYNWQLFLLIQDQQSVRPIGPETLPYLFSMPIIVNKIVYDGWYIFGFISIITLATSAKKHLMVIIPFFVYLVLCILSLTKQGQSGWYLIPFFPFIAIAIAVSVKETLENNSWYYFFLLLIVGLGEIQMLYEPKFGLSQPIFRLLAITLLAPPLLVKLCSPKLSNWINSLWFYLLIIGEIATTYRYIHPL